MVLAIICIMLLDKKFKLPPFESFQILFLKKKIEFKKFKFWEETTWNHVPKADLRKM